MMKQISTALISTVLLLHALGCSNGNVRAAAPAPPPMVEVAPVIQKDVPVQGEWVGTLEGYVNAQIQPQVSGYLIRQDYHEGAFVKKGQLLFEIDPRPFQAVLDQAKGQLAQAEAQMANAETNMKRDIPEAEAHAIPQSQLDTDTQSLRGAKAGVEAGQAAVEQAELNLGYTRVVSLIDGIAGINTVQVGNLLVPQAAVNQQQGTYQVTVVGADKRAQLRTVEVGPRLGTLWVITTGLKPGERVVAVGAEKAKEGELVNPTPYKETEER